MQPAVRGPVILPGAAAEWTTGHFMNGEEIPLAARGDDPDRVRPHEIGVFQRLSIGIPADLNFVHTVPLFFRFLSAAKRFSFYFAPKSLKTGALKLAAPARFDVY